MRSSAWVGLLKKEFRLGKPGALVALLLVLTGLSIGGLISLKIQHSSVMLVIAAALLIGHIFYLPVYLFMSMQGEREKMHLWLHSLHSGRNLLLAKLLNGLIAMFVTLLIPAIVVVSVGSNLIEQFMLSSHPMMDALRLVSYTSIHIAALSLYLTIWGVFLWVLYRTLVPYFGKISWLLLLVLFFAGSWLLGKWEATALYDRLTKWGAVQIEFDSFLVNLSNMNIDIGNTTVMHVGNFVYYAIISILLLLISGWLLDRKVEV